MYISMNAVGGIGSHQMSEPAFTLLGLEAVDYSIAANGGLL